MKNCKIKIFLRVIKNSIIKWPVAVKNEIPSLNGRVIIQSQVAAWSDPIIWGRLFFGAHLCLYQCLISLHLKGSAFKLH